MKLSVATVCDFAQIREGLLFVLSGGITQVRRPAFPTSLDLHLALAFIVDPEEMSGDASSLSVELRTHGGAKPLSGISGDFGYQLVDGPPDARGVLPIVVDLAFMSLPSTGLYEIRVLLAGEDVVSLPLSVAAVPAQEVERAAAATAEG